MFLSIIVPVYNLEFNIQKSLASILPQIDGLDAEIIIVDDGSLDNTWEIANRFACEHSCVKAFRQDNAGVSAARNRGIDEATGDYVMFLDGDDILAPYALEVMCKGVGMSDSTVLVCGQLGRITTYDYNFERKDDAFLNIQNVDMVRKILSWESDVSACAKFFIRERLADVRFCTGKKINEDKYFLLQYLLKNKGAVITTQNQIYGYYDRPGSASNSKYSDKILDMIYFSDLIEQEILTFLPEYYELAVFNNIVTHFAVLKKIIRSKVYKSNKQLFNDIKKRIFEMSKRSSYCGKKHKTEIVSLKFGNLAYIICVKIYDSLFG